MPAPPPPSASYLFAIDTESSEDGSQPREVSPSPPHNAQDEDGHQSPQSKNTKKTRKHKKRKKKKVLRHVHFGAVTVREYERCLGEDVVPLDGGWPLGISNKVLFEYQAAATVDEFEERRQRELRDRWARAVSGLSSDGEDDPVSDSPRSDIEPPAILETRQFDYRNRMDDLFKTTKNPLFGPVSEDARMRLLVESSGTMNDSPDVPKSPTRSKTTQRTRSNSMHHHSSSSDDRPKSAPTSTHRSRSNSEQLYSPTFPSTAVMHIRNELEQIRVSRTLEGSIGCKCRKLDVYLPPSDGSGGKKAQHRRMNANKVKDELRKRGKLPSNTSTRVELEQLLHDLVEKLPCCWGEDCFCKRNGIGCQADACSCWLDSHQKKGLHAVEQYLAVESIRERCGNNMYAVDLDAIHDFRLQYCHVINNENGTESSN